MGFFFSKAWSNIFSKNKQVRILMVGLDAAGKTTIMYKMKINDTVKTIPTVGFNVETMEYKGLSMTMWDIGGQDSIRKLWKHYYEGTDCLIYVVDSADRERIDLASEELHNILNQPELEKACVLVYANKQDLPDAMTPNEVTDKFEMSSIKGRKWIVQGSQGTSGLGLMEGLDWIANILTKSK
jgi:small GTP-binding protein